MSNIYYRPAEVLHWLRLHEEPARPAKPKARQGDWVAPLKDIFETALTQGKSALQKVDQKAAEGAGYILSDTHIEFEATPARRSVAYTSITAIHQLTPDKFQVDYKGGHFTIRPVAHLTTGRIKVPIGWVRNGTEVPYHLLVQELAARCGIPITTE